MSKRVILKKLPREVSGVLVKVNEECRLPDGLADAYEAQGFCVIVGKLVEGAPVAVDTPEAAEALKVAATTKKARAAGKAKAEAAAKKKAAKKKGKG